MSTLIATALVISSLSAAPPADEPDVLSSLPPTFVMIAEFDQAKRELQYVVVSTRLVPEQRVRLVKENGREREVEYTVMKPVYEKKLERVSLDEIDITDTDGKKVEGDDLVTRLKHAKVALLAQTPQGVHALYRQALAKETLIFIPKEDAAAAKGPPATK